MKKRLLIYLTFYLFQIDFLLWGSYFISKNNIVGIIIVETLIGCSIIGLIIAWIITKRRYRNETKTRNY